MAALTPEQTKDVKAKGFLLNRGTDCFSGRVVCAGGVYTAAQLRRIADCAERFGNGSVALTGRQSVEIVGVHYDKIAAATELIGRDESLVLGGTGAKIRPVTACKGTTCIYGLCDTQALAKQLHERYYLGWADVPLPHKFKICVGGCPNSCMKPSLNDFGVQAVKKQGGTMYLVFVGGVWGKKTRVGARLAEPVSGERLFETLDQTLNWYRANANPGERLGFAIERLGLQSLEAALRG